MTAIALDTAALPAADAPDPGAADAGQRPDPRPVQPAGEHANAFAVTSFVLGIASVVSSWTLVAPIIGLVLGVLALRRNTGERTLALWGVWLNIAMLALTALAALVLVFAVGVGLAALPFIAA